MREKPQIEITPAMRAAGVAVYEKWEADHIFGDYTPAAPYAIRELVTSLVASVLAASNSRTSPETAPSRHTGS